MKKYLLTLLTAMICANAFADQCPAPADLNQNGRWSCPVGWDCNFRGKVPSTQMSWGFTRASGSAPFTEVFCRYDSKNTIAADLHKFNAKGWDPVDSQNWDYMYMCDESIAGCSFYIR